MKRAAAYIERGIGSAAEVVMSETGSRKTAQSRPIDGLRERSMWAQGLLAIPEAYFQSSVKTVAWRLIEHLNMTTGLCNPSIPTLAKGCGLSKPTVDRALKLLIDNRWIRRKGTRAFEILADNLLNRITDDTVHLDAERSFGAANRIADDAIDCYVDDADEQPNRIIHDRETASPMMRKHCIEQGRRLKATPNNEMSGIVHRDPSLAAPAADGRIDRSQDELYPIAPPRSDAEFERMIEQADERHEYALEPHEL